MTTGSNSEANEVDDAAKRIGTSLDADDNGWRADTAWLSKGPVRVWISGGSKSLTVDVPGVGELYRHAPESSASRVHIWQAFTRWQGRRIAASIDGRAPRPHFVDRIASFFVKR